MAYSICAQRVAMQLAREKSEARAAAEREEQERRDRVHATWLDRRRAATHLGVSFDQLRRMMTAGTSPAFAKLGHRRQSRTLFPVWELDSWKASPAAYRHVRAERMAELARAAHE